MIPCSTIRTSRKECEGLRLWLLHAEHKAPGGHTGKEIQDMARSMKVRKRNLREGSSICPENRLLVDASKLYNNAECWEVGHEKKKHSGAQR